MKAPMKGTVTPISSLYSPEEAQKASERVQEAISERQKELEQLLGFHSDNTSLINLVSKLPDHLHHDIMVPFGKAAFFPGRLIHTNEFLGVNHRSCSKILVEAAHAKHLPFITVVEMDSTDHLLDTIETSKENF